MSELDKTIEELEAEVLAELEEAAGPDAPKKGAMPAQKSEIDDETEEDLGGDAADAVIRCTVDMADINHGVLRGALSLGIVFFLRVINDKTKLGRCSDGGRIGCGFADRYRGSWVDRRHTLRAVWLNTRTSRSPSTMATHLPRCSDTGDRI